MPLSTNLCLHLRALLDSCFSITFQNQSDPGSCRDLSTP
jgi:hypothetical protein